MEFYHVPSVPMYVHYIFATVFLGIVLATILGNSFAIYVFLRHRKLFMPYTVFIFSLCVCDLAVGLFGTSLVAVTSFTGGWIFGVSGCTFHGTMMTFLGLSQISILTSLSAYRCASVVTFQLRKKLTLNVCICIVMSCFIYSLILSLGPAVFGWSSFGLEPLRTSCAPNWHGISEEDKSYSIMLFVVCFLLPLSVIAVSYSMILRKVFFSRHNPVTRNQALMERRVTKTTIIMIGTFLASWTPYAGLSVYVLVSEDANIDPILGTVPAVIAKMSTIWNPIIFLGLNKSFREAWFESFPFCKLITRTRVLPSPGVIQVQERDDTMLPRGPLITELGDTTAPTPNDGIVLKVLSNGLDSPVREMNA